MSSANENLFSPLAHIGLISAVFIGFFGMTSRALAVGSLKVGVTVTLRFVAHRLKCENRQQVNKQSDH